MNGGVLSVSANANLGLPSQNASVYLNSGTLVATGTFSALTRAVNLGGAGGTIDVTGGITLTIAGQVGSSNNGVSSLTKIDTGTLTLTGTNNGNYTGGTFILGGTLNTSANGNLGSNAGAVTINGVTLGVTASYSLTNTTSIVLGSNSGSAPIAAASISPRAKP